MPDLQELNIPEQVIKSNISKMKGDALKRKNRTNITKLLKEMAYESWHNKIPRMPAEPTNKDKRAIVPDILGFLLRSFSYLYRTPPVRTSEDESSASVFQKKLWNYDGGLDPSMVLSDQFLRLSGSILLQVSWLETPDGNPSPWDGEDGYKITPYTSDQFLTLDGVSPQYPEAVLIKKGSKWEYWDALFTCETDERGKSIANPFAHNMGILPFVLAQNIASWPDAIAPRMGTDDIYVTIKNFGGMMREMGWTALLQRGQPWIAGEAKEQIMLAPDATIKVEQGGTFGVAANAANLEGMMKVLEDFLTILTVSLGLPSRTFKIDRSSAISGVAIQLDQMELESDRQNRTVIFRGIEERIARIVAHQEIAAGRATVNTIKPQISIRFRQPEPIMTYAERQGRATWMWSNKLCSPNFAVGELYPSASIEEVRKVLDEGEAYWGEDEVGDNVVAGNNPETLTNYQEEPDMEDDGEVVS